eukprot:1147118-Pelagomonas_calceolata.AAC.3
MDKLEWNGLHVAAYFDTEARGAEYLGSEGRILDFGTINTNAHFFTHAHTQNSHTQHTQTHTHSNTRTHTCTHNPACHVHPSAGAHLCCCRCRCGCSSSLLRCPTPCCPALRQGTPNPPRAVLCLLRPPRKRA